MIPQAVGQRAGSGWVSFVPRRHGRWLLLQGSDKLSGVSVGVLSGGIEVRRGDQPVSVPSLLSPERTAEIDEVIDRITRWATEHGDIVGLLLVGSCARGAARPDSDIDIVLLTTDESRYLVEDDWAAELGLGELIRTRSWGPITERRYSRASGLEVEMNIGSPTWAKTDPVDPGTHRVITDGARVLHDPEGVCADLLAAC